MKIKEKTKMGPKGKASEGPVGWVRLLMWGVAPHRIDAYTRDGQETQKQQLQNITTATSW